MVSRKHARLQSTRLKLALQQPLNVTRFQLFPVQPDEAVRGVCADEPERCRAPTIEIETHLGRCGWRQSSRGMPNSKMPEWSTGMNRSRVVPLHTQTELEPEGHIPRMPCGQGVYRAFGPHRQPALRVFRMSEQVPRDMPQFDRSR